TEAAGPQDPASVGTASADRPAAPAGPSRGDRFDATFLGRLSAALAREIGPVAKLIVRRAADRAGSPAALVAAVTESVPAAAGPAFLARLGDLAAGPTTRTVTTGPPRETGADLLARVERALARHIGPVARVLVKDAARRAQSPRELFESLAVHIESADAR